MPPRELGSERLAQGRLEATHVARLADHVEHFHRAAATARPGMPGSGMGMLVEPLPGDLAQAAPGASSEACRSLEHWLRSQAAQWLPRMQERLASGHVREGHGDLRLGRVAVQEEEARMLAGNSAGSAPRWTDVLGDAGGLVVDLMAHGRRDLAFVFLNRYLELSGDYGGLDLLRFYLVQRAVARALVLARARHPPDGPGAIGPREHLMLALRLVHSADPRLLITFGPPHTGKSFMARLLSARTGAILVAWEAERERLLGRQAGLAAPPAGPTSLQPAGAGPASAARPKPAVARPAPVRAVQAAGRAASRWSEDAGSALDGTPMNMLVHDRLRTLAGKSLAAGYPTIVDGNFLQRWQRDGLRELAASLGVPFTILDCRARADVPLPGTAPPRDDGDDLGDREQGWALALGPGESLSPATLTAHWLRVKPLPGLPASASGTAS